MKEFKEYLQIINKRLELPQPTKAKILLEIYYDLKSAYENYISEGLDKTEAIAKAKGTFGLSQQSIKSLMDIHQSTLRKTIDRFVGASRIPMEKIIVSFIFIMIGIFSLNLIMKGYFMENISYFVYPVFFLFILVLCISGWKLYQLYIRKDHQIKTLRNGMGTIAVIMGIIIFCGFSGYIIESYWAAQTQLYQGPFFILCFIGPENILSGMAAWMAKAASLMIVCISSILFSSLLWFLLYNKIQLIECDEANLLLAE